MRESPSVWAYPTILTLHTLGLAVLVGANWMVDLRVLGFARALPLSVLSRAFPIMWAGFWVNFVTGLMLFAADASTKGSTRLFVFKLALIACAVVAAMAMKRFVYVGGRPVQRIPSSAKALALVSIVLWLCAITAGRMMAYV